MNHMKLKHILALMLVVIATTTGCSAKNNRAIKHHEIVAADSIMKKAVGDSIYSIITHAKKINASLITRVDSTCKIVTKKVSPKDFGIIRFIVTNPKNYLTDATVYGLFMPQFQMTFINKKRSVTLKYDFGLRKLGVFNDAGKQIAMRDLASDNMLRFACMTFPNDKFLNDLLRAKE